MEDIMATILPQMPTVAILLLVFFQLRNDVNQHLGYLESLIEKLIDATIEKE